MVENNMSTTVPLEYLSPRDYITDIIHQNETMLNLDGSSCNEYTVTWAASIRNRLQSLRGDINNPPQCSVVVPACNEERYIMMFLESLAQQQSPLTSPLTMEVIVVDNNSEEADRTADFSRMAGVHTIQYRSDRLRSIVGARTVGLSHAAGDIVLTTDADCIVQKNWVAQMAKVLDEPCISCVTGHVMHYGASPGLKIYDTANLLTRTVGSLLRTSHASGQNMAFRRTDAYHVGGYDLSERVWDDMFFCERLKSLGEKHLLQNPAAVVYTSPRRVNQEGIVSRFLMQWQISNGAYIDNANNLKNHR